MTLAVRPATPDDLPAILDIYNHAVLHSTATADYEPHTLDMRTKWYAERTAAGFPIFVATEAAAVSDAHAEAVVGWSAYGLYHSRVGYRFTVENSVYVAHDQRGRGVGKALLAPLLEHAQAHGFHAMLASIDSENEASLRLHSAYGFEPVARLKQTVFKFDRWLDVIYMQKIFDAAK